MKITLRCAMFLAIFGLCLFAADPAYADALDVGNQKLIESKEKLKNIVTTIMALGLIIGLGSIAWTVAVDRRMAVLITGGISLIVVAICGAILASI